MYMNIYTEYKLKIVTPGSCTRLCDHMRSYIKKKKGLTFIRVVGSDMVRVKEIM